MLTDFWRDIIGIVGFLLTAAGLIYAIAQIRKTKSAAQAAEEAAKSLLQESQKDFRKYMMMLAHRYVNEVKIHLQPTSPDWGKAAMRVNDLADQMAQMAPLASFPEPMVAELRKWANTFHRQSSDRAKRFSRDKWSDFLLGVESHIDRLITLFESETEEKPNDY